MEPTSIDTSKLAISIIAEPMASEKLTNKVISLVSKLSKLKLIKRGVKEVNKYFRKQQGKDCKALCILAGDVSPVDVICHIPVLCEKRKVPYIYIPSRQALGTASQTKRPTSVILLLEPPEDNNYLEKYQKMAEVLNKYQSLSK